MMINASEERKIERTEMITVIAIAMARNMNEARIGSVNGQRNIVAVEKGAAPVNTPVMTTTVTTIRGAIQVLASPTGKRDGNEKKINVAAIEKRKGVIAMIIQFLRHQVTTLMILLIIKGENTEKIRRRRKRRKVITQKSVAA